MCDGFVAERPASRRCRSTAPCSGRRRSAAYAGSVMLTADGGGSAQETCIVSLVTRSLLNMKGQTAC